MEEILLYLFGESLLSHLETLLQRRKSRQYEGGKGWGVLSFSCKWKDVDDVHEHKDVETDKFDLAHLEISPLGK